MAISHPTVVYNLYLSGRKEYVPTKAWMAGSAESADESSGVCKRLLLFKVKPTARPGIFQRLLPQTIK